MTSFTYLVKKSPSLSTTESTMTRQFQFLLLLLLAVIALLCRFNIFIMSILQHFGEPNIHRLHCLCGDSGQSRYGQIHKQQGSSGKAPTICLGHTGHELSEKKQRVLLHRGACQPVVKGLECTEAAEMCGMFTHFILLVNRLLPCDAGTASENLKKNY